MAEVGGPLNPTPSVPGNATPAPAGPSPSDPASEKDKNVSQDNFESYLNQQTIMSEDKVKDSQIYDAANDIGQDSVYLKPGETKPT